MPPPELIPQIVRTQGSLPARLLPQLQDDIVEAAEHRRQLVSGHRGLAYLTRASIPGVSYCTADTTVSGAAYVSVTGMAQTLVPGLTGSYDLVGSIYVQEVTPGQFSVRVVSGVTPLWTVTVQEQGALLRQVGSARQLAIWVMPIGAPGALSVATRTSYSVDVEIAAPVGSYRVLTGSGKESWLGATLRPQLET